MNPCFAQLQRWLVSRSDSTALLWLDASGQLQQLKWPELYAVASACAQSIDQQGFKPGDRLLHQSGNTATGVIVALASMLQGTIEVPLDPQADAVSAQAISQLVTGRWFELPDWLTNLTPATRFTDSQPAIAPYDNPSAAALILFTSGSTGEPKGVTLSYDNLFQNASGKLLAVPQTPGDVRLTLLPIWHAYARTCDLITWLLSGCSLAIGLGFADWLRLAPIVRPTLINTVPSMAQRIADTEFASRSTSRLHLLGCGGAAMSEALFDPFTDRGITVIQGYGLTEASPVICSATPQNARPGYVGCPIAGCETRIDETGRLSVRGPGVMLGYWNPKTQAAEPLMDEWLDTGDYVTVSPEDGQFKILGRADDRLVLSNGRKLFPGPIEQSLQQIAGVRHALLLAQDRYVIAYLDADRSQRSTEYYVSAASQIVESFPDWQRPRSFRFLLTPLADHPELFSRKGTLKRQLTERLLPSLQFLDSNPD